VADAISRPLAGCQSRFGIFSPSNSYTTWYNLAVVGALLSLPFLGAAPAQQPLPVTFVVAKVTGTGTCAAPKTPSRTFNLALGHVSADGEVKTLAAR